MNHPNIVKLAAAEIDSPKKVAFLLQEVRSHLILEHPIAEAFPLTQQCCHGGDLFSELGKFREGKGATKYMLKETVRSYFIQLVFALHYMHDATERCDRTHEGAYFHQDLKPENSKSCLQTPESSLNRLEFLQSSSPMRGGPRSRLVILASPCTDSRAKSSRREKV
jgi:serine/threonine protein kinase